MDLNTPIFAISRAAGWAAHIIEEKFAEAAPKAMLYRPKANYVGKYAGPQGYKYVPIEKELKIKRKLISRVKPILCFRINIMFIQNLINHIIK